MGDGITLMGADKYMRKIIALCFLLLAAPGFTAPLPPYQTNQKYSETVDTKTFTNPVPWRADYREDFAFHYSSWVVKSSACPTGVIIRATGTIEAKDLRADRIQGDGNLITGISTASLNAVGTPSAASYLRGDNTWTTPAGAGDMAKADYAVVSSSVVDQAFNAVRLNNLPGGAYAAANSTDAVRTYADITFATKAALNSTAVSTGTLLTATSAQATYAPRNSTDTVRIYSDATFATKTSLNSTAVATGTINTSLLATKVATGTVNALALSIAVSTGNFYTKTASDEKYALDTATAVVKAYADATFATKASTNTANATSISAGSYLNNVRVSSAVYATYALTAGNAGGGGFLVSPSTGILPGVLDYSVKFSTANANAAGTPSASTYLRGDNTWGTPSTGSIANIDSDLDMNGYSVINASSVSTAVASVPGAFYMYESSPNGNHYTGIGAPDNLTTTYMVIFPSTVPASNNSAAFFSPPDASGKVQMRFAEVTNVSNVSTQTYTLPPFVSTATEVSIAESTAVFRIPEQWRITGLHVGSVETGTCGFVISTGASCGGSFFNTSTGAVLNNTTQKDSYDFGGWLGNTKTFEQGTWVKVMRANAPTPANTHRVFMQFDYISNGGYSFNTSTGSGGGTLTANTTFFQNGQNEGTVGDIQVAASTGNWYCAIGYSAPRSSTTEMEFRDKTGITSIAASTFTLYNVRCYNAGGGGFTRLWARLKSSGGTLLTTDEPTIGTYADISGAPTSEVWPTLKIFINSTIDIPTGEQLVIELRSATYSADHQGYFNYGKNQGQGGTTHTGFSFETH
jgi:hypothetical protein